MRETLGNSHHQDCDSNDDELDVVGEIVHVPVLVIGVELVYREPDGEDEDSDETDGHPSVANLNGEVGQLGLEDTFLLLLNTNWRVLARGLGNCRLARGRVGQTVVGQRISHSLLHVNFLLLFLLLLLHLVSSNTQQCEDDPRLGVDPDRRDEDLAAAAPSSVKMIPAWELTPTAVTRTLPLPSMTWVPDNTIGSTEMPFLT